jgi:hypothetical protein
MTAAGGHGGATRPTEMGRDHEGNDKPETASADGIVSVCLGRSEFGAELRICGRRFDSSRGHPAFMRMLLPEPASYLRIEEPSSEAGAELAA